MSTRPQTKPTPVIDAESMATNIISEVTILSNQSILSYAYSWSGTTPIGTIAVEASNDYGLLANGFPDPNNAGTWNTLPLNEAGSIVTSLAVTGNTGNGAIDIDATGFYAIRTVYTASSGTGTLTATVVCKVA